jgi:hypothetical protein
MSRIESIGLTRSQGRPASLNEARRALVNPDLRSIVHGSRADSLDLREQVAMASDTHACLDEAAKASLAGRLFVVDHATLVGDLGHASARRSDAVRDDGDFHARFRSRLLPAVHHHAKNRWPDQYYDRNPDAEQRNILLDRAGVRCGLRWDRRPNHGGAARRHRCPPSHADRAAEMSAHVACSAIAGMAEFDTNVGSA